jgi:predicted dienelactone hydrolase
MKALSTAFFQTHLSNNSEYSPYLSAGYAQLISQEPISLILIKSLTPNQIDGLVENP